MNDVSVDNAVENVSANETEVPVNRCESSCDKGPLLTVIVRNILMSVVEVRNSHYCNVNHLTTRNHPGVFD